MQFCSTRKSAESSCDIILKMMDKKRITSLWYLGRTQKVKDINTIIFTFVLVKTKESLE